MQIQEEKEHGDAEGDENINAEFERHQLAPDAMQRRQPRIAGIHVGEVFDEISGIRRDEIDPDIHLDDARRDRYGRRWEKRDHAQQKQGAAVFPVMSHETLADILDLLMPDSQILRNRLDEQIFELIAEKIVQPRAERLADIADDRQPHEVPERFSLDERQRSGRPHDERRRDRTDDFLEKRTGKYKPFERYPSSIR